MKNAYQRMAGFCVAGTLAFSILAGTSCNKNDSSNPPPSANNSYDEVKLVADQSSSGAASTDPNLTNPWGIAIGGTGAFWISANHSGKSTIYDRTGASLLAAVTIPAPGSGLVGSPTGVVYNATSDFVIGVTGETSKFIFATESGTIAAWSSAGLAVTVADRSSANAVYKGLTIANDGTANFIYAADFKNAKIDVFDHSFAYVSDKVFSDSSIPAGFAPFNVRNIGGMLYVTYAKQKGPDNEDDEAGAGNGYIDVFRPNGTLVSRFASQGSLNSPWGIAVAPAGFGLGSNAILVGNFGDGHINAFNQDGTVIGPLKDTSKNALTINGLWDITFPVNGVPSGDPNQLFFTAGPDDETHGIFGYLKLH